MAWYGRFKRPGRPPDEQRCEADAEAHLDGALGVAMKGPA
jgi:hypothetical protein